MFARKFSAALLISGLFAGTALAQGALVEIEDNVQVSAFSATADQVDDWNVYAADGTKIGDIEEVVGTAANTPTALVVDFDGKGGYADRDVVIPFDQFTKQNDRLVLNADAAAVGAMPVWND
ncbi:PRC-barrel domain-containing protein [Mesorhizobium sp. SB112]|uniref:PRC-barrel domain-containing protein n=1 Tax=Mesorhizobium sp. SB112 TaxID=3151853 RepID=UPI003267BA6F